MSTRRFVLTLPFLLLALAGADSAAAQTGPSANARHVEYWDPADLPLEYVIHQDGAPILTDGSDFAALQAGFAVWATLADVTLSATYLGTTTQSAGAGLDGINLVSFQDPQFQTIYGSAVIAVGITTSFTEVTEFNGRTVQPGQVVDADMLFNPARTFSTDTGGTGPDLMAVTVHEAGHLFGFSHSCVVSATMFPALPGGRAARSLETDDRVLAFMAYPDPVAASEATRLEGTVTDGATGLGLPGAIVFAISAAQEDTAACQYTLPDGSYRFVGLDPGDYYLWVHPLDGSAGANGVTPAYINDLVSSTAVTNFLPEWWDASESNADDANSRDAVSLSVGASTLGIDVVTNVDAVAPTVTRAVPADGATEIRADALVALEFSEPIDFESARTNFRLERIDGEGTTGVAGSLVTLGSGSKLIFDPSDLLQYDAQYRLIVGAGVEDRFGNPLGADRTTTFTIESAPPLAINSVSPQSVAAGAVVVVDGQGFETSDPAANVVDFGGVLQPAMTAGPASIAVRVPAGLPLQSLPLTVRTPDGQISNAITVEGLPSFEIARGAPSGAADLTATPRALALLPDGAFAIVATDQGLASVVTATSAPDYLVVTDIPTDAGTDDVVTTPDGTRAYAVSHDARQLIVVDTNYGDLASRNPSFNAILDVLPVEGIPIAVAVDGAGQRVFVSTTAGTVQMWDVRLGNATFHQQIGEVSLPATPVGNLAVDRVADLLYVLTSAGQLVAYPVDDFTADPPSNPFLVDLGTSPSSITLDPAGEMIYVVDAESDIAVLDRGDFSRAGTIPVPTASGTFAISPNGGLGYLASRTTDAVQVVDLDPTRPGYLSVATDFEVGLRPVDVAIAPSGDFTYVIEEGSLRLTVLGIGFGPIVDSIVPTAARPGDIVVLAGSGFAPSDPSVPELSTPSRVYFEDIGVEPVSSTGLDLWVRVPEGFQGGTVRVGTEAEQLGVGTVEQLSNPVVLRGLPGASDAGVSPLRTAVLLEEVRGYPWGLARLTGVVERSPDGRTLLVAGDDQSLTFLDVDPNSRSYGQVLTSFAMPLPGLRGITITPAGTRAFLVFGQDDPIVVLDSDRLSPGFGQQVGEIDFSWIPNFCFNPNRLVAHPNGDIIVVEDVCTETLYCFDTDADGAPGEPLLAISDPALGTAEDVVMHPSGRALYYASSNGNVLVFDFDPFSADTQQVVATLETGATPRALGVTPDGTKLLVVTRASSGASDAVLEVWDTTFLAAPVLQHSLVLEATAPTFTPELIVSPVGDRALIDLGPAGSVYVDLSDAALAAGEIEVDRALLNPTVGRAGLAYAADPFRIFSAAPGDSCLRMVEAVGGIDATLVAGGAQTGTAGRPLPSPIRFQITSAGGNQPVVGATAEVRVVGGGGVLGNGLDYQWIAAGADGTVEIDWVLGPEPDADPQEPTNQLAVTFNAGAIATGEVSAVSVPAAEELPLSVVELRPAAGATDIALSTSTQVLFSRPVDRTSITPVNMRLERAADGTAVNSVYGYADGDRRISLTPVDPLENSTAYTFVIETGVVDLEGGALTSPATLSFDTTGPPPLITRSIDPPAAQVGTEVVIGGEGFDPIAANNVVSFGGTTTDAVASSPNSLLVVVPVGAVTGELVVGTGGQQADPLQFGVLVPQTEPTNEEIKVEPTGVNVRSIAVLPDGSKAYAASRESDSAIPLDLDLLQALDPIPVGQAPVALSAHPDGNTVYCANWGSDDVSVIDTATDTEVGRIPVGVGPLDLVASPSGDRLYVVNSSDETLSVIDIGVTNATYHTVVTTIPTGSTTRGAAITPDGTLLYLGTSDGFLVIDLDPTNFGVVTTVPTGSTTRGAAITPDGTLLILVTATGDLLVVDITEAGNNTVVTTVPTGSTTRGAAITPDGSLLYVFSEDTDEILVYSIEITGSVGALPTGDALGQLVIELDLVDTFLAGRNPEFIAFDPTGSGLGIASNGGQATVTFFNTLTVAYQAPVGGTAYVEPRTLNLDSSGRFVSATVELQNGFYVRNIDLATVTMNGVVPADSRRVSFQDADQDGQEEILLKFDRALFQEQMPEGEFVPVTIEGNLPAAGRGFLVEDTIRTIRPTVTHPRGGETLFGGNNAVITWDSPDGYFVSAVDVHVSPDDGATWYPVVLGSPDTGFASWPVPQMFSEGCRVLVTLYDARGESMGTGMSPQAFTVSEAPVPVVLQEVRVEETAGDAWLQWTIAGQSELSGFHVLRAKGTPQGNLDYQRVTERPLAADLGISYEFLDTEVYGNQEFWYLLEEVRADGSTGFQHGPYRLEFRVGNRLEQNFPNSFNPRTTIRFSVAKEGRARLAIYDLAGRLVDVLVDEVLRPDVHTRVWDGTDIHGRAVSSGVYFYRLQTEDFVASRKMTLVR